MDVPNFFCWTRFGVEAGESVLEILRRKERERSANGGLFFWGIGNAVGQSLIRLIETEREPRLLFSPIRSAPRHTDVAPDEIVVWRRGRTLDGKEFVLPTSSFVTSGRRADQISRKRYALVCNSEATLAERWHGDVEIGALVNLVSGRPVGASQVTAIVRKLEQPIVKQRKYQIAMHAVLSPPYLLELTCGDVLSLSDNRGRHEMGVSHVSA